MRCSAVTEHRNNVIYTNNHDNTIKSNTKHLSTVRNAKVPVGQATTISVRRDPLHPLSTHYKIECYGLPSLLAVIAQIDEVVCVWRIVFVRIRVDFLFLLLFGPAWAHRWILRARLARTGLIRKRTYCRDVLLSPAQQQKFDDATNRWGKSWSALSLVD